VVGTPAIRDLARLLSQNAAAASTAAGEGYHALGEYRRSIVLNGRSLALLAGHLAGADG
jgi:hypothetical protein